MSKKIDSMKYADFFFKLVASLYFRLIIIIYAVFLLITQENSFEPYIYIIGVILYGMGYFFLLTRKMHITRTIWDYIFVCFILYDKEIYEVYNFFFILFPLINSPNHTSNKRNLFLLLFFTIFFFVINLYINSGRIDIYEGCLTIIAITLLLAPEYMRISLNNSMDVIYKEIEEIASNGTRNSHLKDIFNVIIEKTESIFKKNIFSSNTRVEMINAFHINTENNFNTIIKSSNIFVYEYNIHELIKQVQDNKDFYIYFNCKIIINEQEYRYNYNILIGEYLFNIILNTIDNRTPNIIAQLIIHDYLKPILNKITKILNQNDLLYKKNHKINKRIQDKYKFVNSVVKSTHFMSNKFSPIKNVLNILDELNNCTTDELKNCLSTLLLDETKRAQISFKDIEKYSLRVLDKSHNPFIPKDLCKYKIEKIINVIKGIWLIENNENTILFKGKFNNININLQNINLETINIIFVNITENIRKYSALHVHLTFEIIDNKNLKIRFENKIKNFLKVKAELDKLVINYNNHERHEINKRSSHGLAEIKEMTELLFIDSFLELNDTDELFIYNLIIKGEVSD